MQNSCENVGIDVLKVKNHKCKKNVENGVKARLILEDPSLVSSENQDAFRKSCLKFYSMADICLIFLMYSFCIMRKGIILVLLMLYQIYD